MTYTDFILAGLTLNPTKLKEHVGKDENNTLLAWVVLVVMALAESIPAAILMKPPGHSAFANSNLNATWIFIGVFGSGLIGTITLAFFAYLVLVYLFKAEVGFNGVLRVIAAAALWRIIAAIGIFLSSPLNTIILAIGFLLYLAVIFIGVMVYSEKPWYIVLLTGIISFILMFIISDLWSILVVAIA